MASHDWGPGQGRRLNDDEEGRGDKGDDGSSSKRPRLVVDLVDSSDDDGGRGGGDKKPSVSEAQARSTITSTSASAAAANPTARADLPVLPWYLGRVERIPEQFNEQCLAVSDCIAGDFHKAILSNYMYEWDWLLGECPRLLECPAVLACHGDSSTGNITNTIPTIQTYKPAIKKVFQWGTHHSKFAILWYRGGVRVVITTANFIQMDWENKTEGVFVQDFPFLPQGRPEDPSDFGRDLRDYLAALDSWANDSPCQPIHGPAKGHPFLTRACEELKRVDFSGAQAVLVASVPGVHKGGAMKRYGHLRLRSLLEQEPIPAKVFLPPADTSAPWTGGIVCQFSSMGSHAGDGKWVREEFEESLLRAHGLPLPSAQHMRRFRPHVVWPRLVDVAGSLEGLHAGGALPCRPGNVHTSLTQCHQGQLGSCHSFLQRRLSRFAAERWGRQRAMPHFKSFLRYALHRDGGGGGGGGAGGGDLLPRLAWVLISSHNYSKSAWGQLQKQGSQFRVESFELGVLFLPSRYRRFARAFSLTPEHPLLGLSSASHRRVQEDVRGFYSASADDARRVLPGLLPFPMPYAVPPPPYAPTDIPWSSPPSYFE